MTEETIFREVDDELRRDRLNKGWRRYGPYVIGAAVLVVLLVAANEGWNWWQTSNAARSSDQFYAALNLEDGGDIAGALKALDTVIAQGTGQYPTLAKFKQAGLLAKQGKKDDAQAIYDGLATATSNQHLKELALLLAADLLVDKGDVGGVTSRVEGLISPDDPLRNSAREALGLAQYKANDLKGASDSFQAIINDPATPDETRGRIQLYAAQLLAQGAEPPAIVTTTTGAGAAAATPAAETPPSGTAKLPIDAAAPGTASSATPPGVESSQPVTPDSALGLAVPSAPATPAASTDTQPALSTGAGLPSLPTTGAGLPSLPGTGTDQASPAPTTAPATTTPPAAAPASAAPAAASPAATTPAATAPVPPTGTTPATQPVPAAGQ